MLTENKKIILRQKMVSDEDISKIEDYNDQNGIVLFKDGTERRLTTILTRCMGYYSAVENFNKGKASEYKERKWFTEKNALKGLEEG